MWVSDPAKNRWGAVTVWESKEAAEAAVLPRSAGELIGLPLDFREWFDVEATAYLGANARNHYRLETEYQLLLTNRLVLQPQAEIEIYGKPDLEHDRDRGLATLDVGLRLRYLVRRELAPYVGVVWHQKHFGTADIARAKGESTGGARLAVGLRFWL